MPRLCGYVPLRLPIVVRVNASLTFARTGCFLCPKCERKPKTVAKQLTHLAEHVSIWIRRGRRSYEDSDDDEDDDDDEEGSNADGENGDGTDGDGTDERLDRVEEQLDEMRVMIERIAKKMGVMG